MQVMVLEEVEHSLILKDISCPTPNSYEFLIKIKFFGISLKDLYVVDGELSYSKVFNLMRLN